MKMNKNKKIGFPFRARELIFNFIEFFISSHSKSKSKKKKKKSVTREKIKSNLIYFPLIVHPF